MIDKLEDTLQGGYNGLHGEVVTNDCYKLRELKFMPEIVFDLGLNVGVFTRFARQLFPQAFIVSVEPNKENFDIAKKFTPQDDKIIFINKAIGWGKVWHGTTARNGSGETYLSEGLGYSKKGMDERVGIDMELSDVETIMPDELINTYLKDGMKSVLKLDCEGAENIIWQHEPSMQALKKIDYIAAEIHWYSLDFENIKVVKRETLKALKSFEETHHCELDGVHFWATKK